LEKQVRRFGFEGNVAHFVNDYKGVATEPDQLGLQFSCVVSGGQAIDPLGGRGEGHPVPGLAGSDG